MNDKVNTPKYTSPDLSTMKEVIIDFRTKIYIPIDADPEEARNRYWINYKNKK